MMDYLENNSLCSLQAHNQAELSPRLMNLPLKKNHRGSLCLLGKNQLDHIAKFHFVGSMDLTRNHFSKNHVKTPSLLQHVSHVLGMKIQQHYLYFLDHVQLLSIVNKPLLHQ